MPAQAGLAAPVPQRRARSRVFVGFAVLVLASALIGFFTTYLRPVWRAEFHGPWLAHVHGALLATWLLVFLAQTLLIRAREVATHRRLGWAGVTLALLVALSTMGMGVFAMLRDRASGLGELATSFMVGSFTSPLIFAALVTAAVLNRRRPDVHKRLMLLALFAITWPAFFRFRHYFPSVPRPDIWFAFVLPQLLIVLAMLHDKLRLGRVHRVYWTVGLAVIAEAALEVWLFDGPGWRVLAHALAAPFVR
jgi:hypothetical protein